MNTQNCKTANKSPERHMFNYMIYRFVINTTTTRRLLPFWRVSRWNPSYVVGGWWDRSYKGTHVTIKTISLDSVLRLIRCNSCVPSYYGNRGRGGTRRKRKSKARKRFENIRVFFSSEAYTSSLRRDEQSCIRAKFRGELISRSYMRYVRKTSKIIQLQFRTFLSEIGTRESRD